METNKYGKWFYSFWWLLLLAIGLCIECYLEKVLYQLQYALTLLSRVTSVLWLCEFWPSFCVVCQIDFKIMWNWRLWEHWTHTKILLKRSGQGSSKSRVTSVLWLCEFWHPTYRINPFRKCPSYSNPLPSIVQPILQLTLFFPSALFW